MTCGPWVRAVSLAVSFSRHWVDLRARWYDTDAQNTASLLLGVVTRPSSDSHGVQGLAGSNPAVPTGVRASLTRVFSVGLARFLPKGTAYEHRHPDSGNSSRGVAFGQPPAVAAILCGDARLPYPGPEVRLLHCRRR